jgi:hypothetical protein
MLIPTAGLLHLLQALTSVTVSLSRARAAATAARRACAGRVHAVSELTGALCVRVHDSSVCVLPRSPAPQGRLKSPKIESGL